MVREVLPYKKSDLPEEPNLKHRMNLDIKAYAKHSPPLQCTVQRNWIDSLVDNKQFDIVLKKSTADTGAQGFLLGADHLSDLRLSVEDLMQSEINLNCANSTMAGNLGVFYSNIRGEHFERGEFVESKSMVYVIEGDIVLVSKAVLEMLGCIPKHFLRVGVGYERKVVLRTGTGSWIWPNTIPVLLSRTGIYFLTFRFWAIRNPNFLALFLFRLNRIPAGIYRNSISEKFVLFKKC